MKKTEQFNELITRGVAEVIGKEELLRKLQSGKKLRIKFGIDPTGNLLHLGHAVALLKLREFQQLGHTVIFLIGDHTAEIGDPSGRSKERTPLSKEHIKENMKSYCDQAGRMLAMKDVEVRYNSEWYDTLGIMEFVRLTSTVTVPQILHRADFKKRLKEGGDVSVREAFYPFLQGYDSVMLKADVEIGGTDQRFNLLMGRQIQKRYGQKEQDIMMVSLLEGTDGSAKMSKTANNYIALTENPETMFGKVMSIPDTLIVRYFNLTTRVAMEEVRDLEKKMKNGALNPRDVKMRLAREIVILYHGKPSAEKAEQIFIKTFQKKETPDDIPLTSVKKKTWNIVDLLVEIKLSSSKSEARRVIGERGVYVNDRPITTHGEMISLSQNGVIVKKGKRHFLRVICRQ